MKDNLMEIEFQKQKQQTINDFEIGMQVQVNLLGQNSKWGNDHDDNKIGKVEDIDTRYPSVYVFINKDHSAWFLAKELKILPQESQEHRQPKTPQPAQEPTFTLDDLAKACDTSGIGSQKFLELQRALTNLK